MRFLMLAFMLTACQPMQAASPPASSVETTPVSLEPSAAPQSTPNAGLPKGTVTFGSRTIPVEVADTSASRQQGLSGRTSLASDTGMVLAWPTPTLAMIWMPDMNFPLDVIFVRDGRVVGLYENVPPCRTTDDCPSFGPNKGVNYVLEAPAGSAKRWGLKEGDAMTLHTGRQAEPEPSME